MKPRQQILPLSGSKSTKEEYPNSRKNLDPNPIGSIGNDTKVCQRLDYD